MIDIEIMQDASEIIHYDSTDLPYALQERLLSSYTDMKALCHWHEDLELIYIINGEMYYDINDKHILLTAGDVLLVNSHHLHFGYSNEEKECQFICLLFHPDILKSNLALYQKYVSPLIEASSIEYWHFDHTSSLSHWVDAALTALCEMRHQENTDFEYHIIGLLHCFWNEIYQATDPALFRMRSDGDPDLPLQKKMVSYIYQHYAENIELDHIAAAGNISRSKCCKIFQKYLRQSPIAYLNAYRMETSCNLLRDTSYSITEIAGSCGYNHLSYFSKMFFRTYGCTPNQYRKRHQKENAYIPVFSGDSQIPRSQATGHDIASL